jgi:hypothetical protein
MRLKIQLATAAIGYVRVELGCRQIRVPEHFLNRAQIRAAFQQMRGERMAQEVRVDAPRLEPGCGCEAAQDEECARAGERAALSIQEELVPVAPVEVWPPPGVIAAQGVNGFPPDRNDAFLGSLADGSDEPALEIDRCAVEADCFAHSQPGTVEQFDECSVAQRAWRCSRGCVDQPLYFAG